MTDNDIMAFLEQEADMCYLACRIADELKGDQKDVQERLLVLWCNGYVSRHISVGPFGQVDQLWGVHRPLKGGSTGKDPFLVAVEAAYRAGIEAGQRERKPRVPDGPVLRRIAERRGRPGLPSRGALLHRRGIHSASMLARATIP